MRQIYDFERHDPPALNENMLRAEAERRRLRRQTALLAAAGLLLQAAVVLFGYSAIDWYPWLSALCFGHAVVGATGCGVIAVVYSQKGGKTIWIAT